MTCMEYSDRNFRKAIERDTSCDSDLKHLPIDTSPEALAQVRGNVVVYNNLIFTEEDKGKKSLTTKIKDYLHL